MANVIRNISFFFLLMFIAVPNAVFSADYDHKIEFDKISFEWRVENDKIHIQLWAATKGWVAIGFNPTKKMGGADYVIGHVKRGRVKLQDSFGVRELEHIKDELNEGTFDVTEISGEEKNSQTTLRFTIPLDSGDSNDSVINVNGETTVLLAYGKGQDNFHELHAFRTSIKVNLGNGTYR